MSLSSSSTSATSPILIGNSQLSPSLSPRLSPQSPSLLSHSLSKQRLIFPSGSFTSLPPLQSSLSASSLAASLTASPTLSGSLAVSTHDRPHSQAGEKYWTSGRPPWYKADGSPRKTFIVGVCGGSSSGKTTLCHRIVEALNIPWVVLLSMDSFYKNVEGENLEKAHQQDYNFDHPDAFDFETLKSTLKDLKEGKSVQVPIYDFITHSRRPSTSQIYGADVVLFEGILAFNDQSMLPYMDMKVFVDADSDIRLARRLKRDISERGRDINSVLTQYEKFVKPSHDEFIAPSKRFADIIIPNVEDCSVAIDVIVQHIKLQLESQGVDTLNYLSMFHSNSGLPSTLSILPKSPQIKSIMTFLRDKDTPRDIFVFHATRLTRLLIEEAFNFMEFHDQTVLTPTDSEYHGKSCDEQICGVSIVRAGEGMEVALREVVKDVLIGKILIQSHPQTHEPQLIYCKLPKDISQRHVLLMDPLVGTGATALMAIRVLLEHGVAEDKIIFLTLVAAPEGLRALGYTFPTLKVLAAEVDETVDDKFYILPGIGNFGDRYFGTD